MELLLAIVLGALANHALIETWHHGSLFSEWRAWAEAHQPAWWADLLLCPFCLSRWTGACCALLGLLALVEPSWRMFPQFIVAWLCVSGLSNWWNDKNAAITRTPNRSSPETAALERLSQEVPGATDEQRPV